MLHLRICVPTEIASDAIEVLANDGAVSSLAVFRGAGLQPTGDVIEADVAREGANDIIERLRDLGVAEHGSLHIQPIRTWLSREGRAADARTTGSSSDAVVWAEVTQQSYEDTEFTWTYGCFMILATLLAAVAIVVDSQILIIGAMVLGPEFGAIAALGLALVRHRPTLLKRAVITLAGGFTLAILATALIILVFRALGWVTLADVTDPRPQTDFIYHPDKWSFVVAVIAAAAGVLSLTSSKVGGISGVFISVTTIPAAANVALGLAFLEGSEIVGSSLQLLINLTGMAMAGWATLALQQAVWDRVSLRRSLRARRKLGDPSQG